MRKEFVMKSLSALMCVFAAVIHSAPFALAEDSVVSSDTASFLMWTAESGEERPFDDGDAQERGDYEH